MDEFYIVLFVLCEYEMYEHTCPTYIYSNFLLKRFTLEEIFH